MFRVLIVTLSLVLAGCVTPSRPSSDTALSNMSAGEALPTAAGIGVMSFNVESGGADPQVLDDVIARSGVNLWGLSEVQDQAWLDTFDAAAERALGHRAGAILGRTGGADRLAIIYDAEALELREVVELYHIGMERARAPLAARFVELESGTEFIFMVNHLYRSNEAARHEQARLLNQWAQDQDAPVIAVGDYNFDWDIPSNGAERDRGFDLFVDGEIFVWVRPQELVRTQCNRRYNSVLDFVFVSGAARAWPARSEILNRDDAYCDASPERSDHRAVAATFGEP